MSPKRDTARRGEGERKNPKISIVVCQPHSPPQIPLFHMSNSAVEREKEGREGEKLKSTNHKPTTLQKKIFYLLSTQVLRTKILRLHLPNPPRTPAHQRRIFPPGPSTRADIQEESLAKNHPSIEKKKTDLGPFFWGGLVFDLEHVARGSF